MRKTKIVTVGTEGRDKGKTFLLTEMPATRAEKWAAKALLALGRSGVDVSDEAMEAGAVALLSAGLAAFRQMPFEDAEPLLDEMMTCVAFVPNPTIKDPANDLPITRAMIDDDIDEVATLLTLRGELVELHTGFSVTAALSSLGAAIRERALATPTSRKRSGSSSGRVKRHSPNARASTA